jgi:hypothetical protein
MENVRVDSLLGNKKVIVGNPYSDIVLETLGKVYIKSGRNCKLLDDVIKELAIISEKPQEEVYAKTIIVNSIDELQSIDYPGDGYLIFNSLNKSLYISYEDKYIALIESAGYVKKTGDVMSGQLKIVTTTLPPLIVHSKTLVNNLNANYLQGYSGDEFAKKKVDEIISGDWVFTGSNISKANWRFYKNIILDGSISSPFFSSGFSGSGWCMDAKTNTFTVDYLVVRKAMNVYEMVVNKITATNGSLWVSNASKVSGYVDLYEITTNEFLTEFEAAYKVATGNNFSQLDAAAKSILAGLLESRTDILFTNVNLRGFLVGTDGWSLPYMITHIVDAKALTSSETFTDISLLWNKTYLDKINMDFTDDGGSPTLDISNEEFGKVHGAAVAIDIYAETGVESYMDTVSDDNKEIIKRPLYFSYFNGRGNIYRVDFEKEEYPVFKPGDILRCQKYDNQIIKYYDAIVLAPVDLHSFYIQLAESVFDKYTEIEYDEKGNVLNLVEKYNTDLYNRSLFPDSVDEVEVGDDTISIGDRLGKVEIGDSLVQVGNIKSDSGRQNAIYLTSTDDQGPYINILSDLNRPDYSVLYKVPKLDKNGNYITKENEAGEIEYEFEYTKTTKVRIGKLDGILDYTLPADKQPRGYGLYGQNVYLTGNFYLNNGKSVIDASEEGVILKYKNAGLAIVDDPNDPTGEKTMISIDANLVRIGDGTSDLGTLFYVEDGKAYIKTDFIKAQQIEVQKIWNYSFEDTVQTGSVYPSFTGTYTGYPYQSNILHPVAEPPYGISTYSMWIGTYSKYGSSGVFKDATAYPGASVFMESVDGEQVHLLSPRTYIGSGTLDGKVTKVTLTLNIGSFDFQENNIQAWYYNDTNETHYPLTIKQNSGGVIVYEGIIESTVDSNTFTTGISLVPSTKDSIVQPIVSVEVDYEYVQGALNWALWKDGSGSLGRENMFWDKNGNVTLIGMFRTSRDESKVMKIYHDDNTGNPLFKFIHEGKDAVKITYSTYKIDNVAYATGNIYVYTTRDTSSYSSLSYSSVSFYTSDHFASYSASRISLNIPNSSVSNVQTYSRIILGRELPVLSGSILGIDIAFSQTYIDAGQLIIGTKMTDGYEGAISNSSTSGNPFGLADNERRTVSVYRTVITEGGAYRQVKQIDAQFNPPPGGIGLPTTMIYSTTEWRNV